MTPRVCNREPFAGAHIAGGGLLLFMGCGILTVLLAARILPSHAYTQFAAFQGLLGVLVLGPAASLEQASAMRAGHGPALPGRGRTARGAALWLALATALSLPVGGWQGRLFGDEAVLAVLTLVIGSPAVLALAVRRGRAVAGGRHSLVGAAHALAGIGTLAAPFVLHLSGLSWLQCFLVGSVAAWLPAYVVVALCDRRTPAVPGPSVPYHRHSGMAWLAMGNLLLLANLLAVPPLLRWHVADMGARTVADLQLLVSISRLPTTAVLGFLPLLLTRLRPRPPEGTGVPLAALAWVTAAGAAAVLGAALLGNSFVTALTGRTQGLPLAAVVLSTSPALLLCPAVVLMGAAVARHRYPLVCAAWSCGLAVLGVTAVLNVPEPTHVVLVGVLLSAAVPLLVLARGLWSDPRVVA